MNARGESDRRRSTWATSASQPRCRCPPATPSGTVSAVLSSSTPASAQPARSPVAGECPISSSSSRKMFPSDFGRAVPAVTENASPLAWPGVGYGSWPSMTARVAAGWHRSRAANRMDAGGRIRRLSAERASAIPGQSSAKKGSSAHAPRLPVNCLPEATRRRGAGQDPDVTRASPSTLARAAPEAMLSAAISTPLARWSAFPEITSAAAELRSTASR